MECKLYNLSLQEKVKTVSLERPNQKPTSTISAYRHLDLFDFLTNLNQTVIKNRYTGKNRRLDQCILDWTNQCKSRLP